MGSVIEPLIAGAGEPVLRTVRTGDAAAIRRALHIITLAAAALVGLAVLGTEVLLRLQLYEQLSPRHLWIMLPAVVAGTVAWLILTLLSRALLLALEPPDPSRG
jgi:uncharacterized membrane protein